MAYPTSFTAYNSTLEEPLTSSSVAEWLFTISHSLLIKSKIEARKAAKTRPVPRCTWETPPNTPNLVKAFCRRSSHYLQQVVGESIFWPLESLVPKALTANICGTEGVYNVYIWQGLDFTRRMDIFEWSIYDGITYTYFAPKVLAWIRLLRFLSRLWLLQIIV